MSIYNEYEQKIYVGGLDKTNKEGFGTEYYDDGTYYSGYWKRNSKHGLGEVRRFGFLIFTGNFYNNVRKGFGIEFYDNNFIKYEGNFENDMYSGKGILYNRDQTIKHIGFFKNGFFLGE